MSYPFFTTEAGRAYEAELIEKGRREGIEAARKVVLSLDVRDEAKRYEFRADEGDYVPTEDELVILEDFGSGLIFTLDGSIRALLGVTDGR